jgi:DNA topoisomerase VI subunit A
MKDLYSGKEIIRAGEKFLNNEIFNDDEAFNNAMDVLSYWRFQHEEPLEEALSLLQKESLKHDKNAIFSKRLKRHRSFISFGVSQK